MEELSTGRLTLKAESEPRVVVFFIASRTGQQVKRAALNAEGFVLDHFSRVAVDNHLHTVGDRLMEAFGDTPPYAVFSDSLEVYGSDWTDDLLTEFQRRRGYNLTPYLPQLVAGTSPMSGALRHDWGVTLTELVNERYLTPINDWATAHHTRFRSQPTVNPLCRFPAIGWLHCQRARVRSGIASRTLAGRRQPVICMAVRLHRPRRGRGRIRLPFVPRHWT